MRDCNQNVLCFEYRSSKLKLLMTIDKSVIKTLHALLEASKASGKIEVRGRLNPTTCALAYSQGTIYCVDTSTKDGLKLIDELTGAECYVVDQNTSSELVFQNNLAKNGRYNIFMMLVTEQLESYFKYSLMMNDQVINCYEMTFVPSKNANTHTYQYDLLARKWKLASWGDLNEINGDIVAKAKALQLRKGKLKDGDILWKNVSLRRAIINFLLGNMREIRVSSAKWGKLEDIKQPIATEAKETSEKISEVSISDTTQTKNSIPSIVDKPGPTPSITQLPKAINKNLKAVKAVGQTTSEQAVTSIVHAKTAQLQSNATSKSLQPTKVKLSKKDQPINVRQVQSKVKNAWAPSTVPLEKPVP